ncbi:ubiquinone biosynthesis regulatory protein kinase UbiB [Gammaproteobacteria bacterium]|nr:ubiquinone biosynthesis regulatory protein kinase UbiB [Gammaproteobacteria bacterium]
MRSLIHLLRIGATFRRYALLHVIARLQPRSWWARLLLRLDGVDRRPLGERLRESLQELGPVFIKFGQVLSTRPDLIGEAIADELVLLQDQVPPFSGSEARSVIEKALRQPIESVFERFDNEAMASASVAQVHAARLPDGEDVIVKVIRPGIQPIVERDIAMLYSLARLVERFLAIGPRLRAVEVVAEFDATLHDELDLLREAANCNQVRENFKDSELVYVPKVWFDLCDRNVMVQERIYGISSRDIEGLRDAGLDFRQLAYNGVEIFFTQAFRDGFFHADMHPGNVFIGENGQYRAIDFGIMGTLSERDKRYLAENFLGFFNRDYKAIADAHLRAGWVPSWTRADEFEAAIRSVCEPIFARPISEISFGKFVMRLFQVARRFEMPIQPQLVLLEKTLLQIEGMGRALYPQLDLWDSAKPFLEKWMKEQTGPRAAARALRREAPRWATLGPELPGLAGDALVALRDQRMGFVRQAEELQKLREEIQRRERRLVTLVFGVGLLLLAGGWQWLQAHPSVSAVAAIGSLIIWWRSSRSS